MSNKEYHQLSNKFVEQKPALSPKIQVNVKLDITLPSTEDHDDKGVREEADHHNQNQPLLVSANGQHRGTVHHTGTQPLEQNRPEHLMLTPHSGCAGFWKSVMMGKTLVRRGMVYIIEGDRQPLKILVIAVTILRIG